jgi:hypothetical protein
VKYVRKEKVNKQEGYLRCIKEKRTSKAKSAKTKRTKQAERNEQ